MRSWRTVVVSLVSIAALVAVAVIFERNGKDLADIFDSFTDALVWIAVGVAGRSALQAASQAYAAKGKEPPIPPAATP